MLSYDGFQQSDLIVLGYDGFQQIDIIVLGYDGFQYNFDKTIVDSGTTHLRLPSRVFEEVVDRIQLTLQVSEWPGVLSLLSFCLCVEPKVFFLFTPF